MHILALWHQNCNDRPMVYGGVRLFTISGRPSNPLRDGSTSIMRVGAWGRAPQYFWVPSDLIVRFSGFLNVRRETIVRRTSLPAVFSDPESREISAPTTDSSSFPAKEVSYPVGCPLMENEQLMTHDWLGAVPLHPLSLGSLACHSRFSENCVSIACTEFLNLDRRCSVKSNLSLLARRVIRDSDIPGNLKCLQCLGRN